MAYGNDSVSYKKDNINNLNWLVSSSDKSDKQGKTCNANGRVISRLTGEASPAFFYQSAKVCDPQQSSQFLTGVNQSFVTEASDNRPQEPVDHLYIGVAPVDQPPYLQPQGAPPSYEESQSQEDYKKLVKSTICSEAGLLTESMANLAIKNKSEKASLEAQSVQSEGRDSSKILTITDAMKSLFKSYDGGTASGRQLWKLDKMKFTCGSNYLQQKPGVGKYLQSNFTNLGKLTKSDWEELLSVMVDYGIRDTRFMENTLDECKTSARLKLKMVRTVESMGGIGSMVVEAMELAGWLPDERFRPQENQKPVMAQSK